MQGHGSACAFRIGAPEYSLTRLSRTQQIPAIPQNDALGTGKVPFERAEGFDVSLNGEIGDRPGRDYEHLHQGRERRKCDFEVVPPNLDFVPERPQPGRILRVVV
jgi:hypothetical protein